MAQSSPRSEPEIEGHSRGIKLRLSGFYAGHFLVAGVMLPFWPLYLSGRGMSATEIGLLLAVALWLRAAAGPIVAHVADRSGHTRTPLLACAVGALVIMVAFFWAEGFWPLLAVTVAFYFAYSTIGPLGETIALRSVSAHHGYGRVRLWGSLAFVVASIVGGFVLDARGTLESETVVLLMLGTLVVMVVSALPLPDTRGPGTSSSRAPFLDLVGSRGFLLFLAATGLIHTAHTVYYGFSSLHWSSLGISKGTIGLLWAEGVAAEILLFAFGARLVQRLGAANLFLIAAGAGAVRWAVLALTAELWVLALAQLLHGATFGAMHLGAMMFIARSVPAAFANSAQSLYSGVAHGAGLGIGFLVAGMLYEGYGSGSYWAGAVTSALAIPVALWLARERRALESSA